jgi:hypothetical protein
MTDEAELVPGTDPLRPPSDPVLAGELTPRLARRAWAEPHVRLWWVTALAVLGAGLYVGAMQTADWYREVRLIRHGVPVTAKVVSVNYKDMPGNSQPGDGFVVINFELQGQQRQVTGNLSGRPASQFIKVGEKVDFKVDPNDPTVWTSRQQPAPLSGELGIPLAAAMAAAVVAAVSWMLRRRVLRSYRLGERAAARAVSRFRSALAPRLWAVRCVLIDSDDKRIFTVYVPSRFPSEPGEIVEIILPPKAGGNYRPIAAAWFE